MKAYLAGTAQMLCDGADKLAVEVEVAQASVFAIADQHHWLVITCVHRDSMTAIEQAIGLPFSCIAGAIVAVFVEAEEARVPISIGDEDAPIRGWDGRG